MVPIQRTHHILRYLAFSSWFLCSLQLWSQSQSRPEWAIAIHGGAGTILKENMTPEQEKAYHSALREALAAGQAVLAKGGTSIEAVIAAIVPMEDSPLFNAGKGAVFTHDGHNELDASIMRGQDLQAGAVAGVKRIRNPILLAQAVMDHSPHVLLTGDGAEAFAKTQGIAEVDPKFFFTQRRWDALQKAKAKQSKDKKHGTVGVVALDRFGNLAAGTSTGGMTNKRYGRVGDSPIIGAGTYADNQSVAVSATGQGEYYIRGAIAYDIAARVAYKGETVAAASNSVIHKKLTAMGGSGGVIVLDASGNIAMTFNTAGMYRGSWVAGSDPQTAIYKN